MSDNQDVAVVHWQDGGVEKQARAYTIQMLSQLIETMNKRGYVYWVCLTQLDTIIPARSQKPSNAFEHTDSSVDRVEVIKRQHGAFREVTRTKQVRYPPPFDKVKEAYGQ